MQRDGSRRRRRLRLRRLRIEEEEENKGGSANIHSVRSPRPVPPAIQFLLHTHRDMCYSFPSRNNVDNVRASRYSRIEIPIVQRHLPTTSIDRQTFPGRLACVAAGFRSAVPSFDRNLERKACTSRVAAGNRRRSKRFSGERAEKMVVLSAPRKSRSCESEKEKKKKEILIHGKNTLAAKKKVNIYSSNPRLYNT